MPEEKLDNILQLVVHINDKIGNEMATKGDLVQLEDKLLNHIDGFIKLHETLDQELVALRNKYDRLEERMKQVEEKLSIPTN